MRFVRCGSKMFDPKAVAAVDLASGPSQDEVVVALPNCGLTFRGEEAEAVRAYYQSIHATDLLRRDEDELTEPAAANHTIGEC